MAKQTSKEENLDKLNLKNNELIKLLIKTEGNSKEEVILSEKIVKINRKGKKQDRHLMITGEAVYNLKPNSKYKASQRRVKILDIGMITLSTKSPEFAIHIPGSYDYHLASKNKEGITDLIAKIYGKLTEGDLVVVDSELKHLKDLVLSKKLAKYESHSSQKSSQDAMRTASQRGLNLSDVEDDDDDITDLK